MSIAAVVTEGYGSFGTIPLIITMGYSIGAIADIWTPVTASSSIWTAESAVTSTWAPVSTPTTTWTPE